MATIAVPGNRPQNFARGRQFDNVFFSIMALLILVTVFVGFSRTYFLAGVFRAPLPNLLIHIHGAVFSSWILLLITQIGLVSAGRVDISSPPGSRGILPRVSDGHPWRSGCQQFAGTWVRSAGFGL
jgi:hypothetical protein